MIDKLNKKRPIIKRNKGRFKNKKVISFIVLSLFTITVLLPGKIEAFTGKNMVDKKGTNILAFSFPSLKVSDKDLCDNVIKYVKDSKSNLESNILKSEISFLNSNDEPTACVFNNEITAEDEKKNDSQDEELFNLNENSIEKFEDNITKNEIITKDDQNFKNSIYKNKDRSSKPQVLIYHSHTKEGFDTKAIQNPDPKQNICAVGDVLQETLEKEFNINVIHDKTIHDENYTKSYRKSGETLDRYLKTYGKFDLVIDLHRDSVGKREPVTCKINGKSASKYMFVVTTANPNYKNQRAIIDKLVSISNKNYPGMLRGNGIYSYKKGTGYFNQNKSPNSLLIEMGSYCNTLDEGKTTAKYLSQIIAEYLNSK